MHEVRSRSEGGMGRGESGDGERGCGFGGCCDGWLFVLDVRGGSGVRAMVGCVVGSPGGG